MENRPEIINEKLQVPSGSSLERLERARENQEVERAESGYSTKSKLILSRIKDLQEKTIALRNATFPEQVAEFDVKNAGELLDSLRRSLEIEKSVLKRKSTTDHGNIQERIAIIQGQINDILDYLGEG